jgi:hypothetical protein
MSEQRDLQVPSRILLQQRRIRAVTMTAGCCCCCCCCCCCAAMGCCCCSTKALQSSESAQPEVCTTTDTCTAQLPSECRSARSVHSWLEMRTPARSLNLVSQTSMCEYGWWRTCCRRCAAFFAAVGCAAAAATDPTACSAGSAPFAATTAAVVSTAPLCIPCLAVLLWCVPAVMPCLRLAGPAMASSSFPVAQLFV